MFGATGVVQEAGAPLRPSISTRQVGRVAPGACTKSKSDPAKMLPTDARKNVLSRCGEPDLVELIKPAQEEPATR
jgi:hypothetical protein